MFASINIKALNLDKGFFSGKLASIKELLVLLYLKSYLCAKNSVPIHKTSDEIQQINFLAIRNSYS